jgi:hypothetical protein
MDLVTLLGQWPGAVLLQRSGTAYLLVNASHILGIAMLVGGILPLDLRLLGFFRSVPVAIVAPFLSRMAAIGLALALATGFCLFTVRPREYLANPAFLWKGGFLLAALANIALQHASSSYGRALAGEIATAVRIRAGASVSLWLAVLLAGRWIGFV